MGHDIEVFSIPSDLHADLQTQLKESIENERQFWHWLNGFKAVGWSSNGYPTRIGVEKNFSAWQNYLGDEDCDFQGDLVGHCHSGACIVRTVPHSRLSIRLQWLQKFTRYHQGTSDPEIEAYLDQLGNASFYYYHPDSSSLEEFLAFSIRNNYVLVFYEYY